MGTTSSIEAGEADLHRYMSSNSYEAIGRATGRNKRTSGIGSIGDSGNGVSKSSAVDGTYCYVHSSIYTETSNSSPSATGDDLPSGARKDTGDGGLGVHYSLSP